MVLDLKDHMIEGSMRNVAHHVTAGPQEGKMADVRGCLRGETLNSHQHTVVKEKARKPNLKRRYVQFGDKLKLKCHKEHLR